ncbi:dihydroxyacetone kinase transcriptional activator DhaS [Salisediminibacterium beveridgei]|uniref:HTH-type dhaKLM operon transcriptional activator dhaS n=1 Tax=Salisediminibacterium beveridgei TaxID=632773 RepID=A0A1D7QS51_9BACI|nr:dihydroxyacetone kinase transcriptional activator DhaS [Salisediminibacterium beveridgei]AOM81818.1 HTH-type dhaKLM operon transcriptional activator dhaS [Salisediminibacterium beveridgei]
MTHSLITKKIIARSLKDLMEQKAFAKISVRDIMACADLRRQTFYYHFQDKYELLTWIYEDETRENSIDFFQYDDPERIFDHLLHYVYDNRTFYEKAIQVHEQNGFFQALTSHMEALYRTLISEWAKQDGFRMENDQVDLLVRFYSRGFTGVVENWLIGGCREDPVVIAKELNDVVHIGLRTQLSQKSGETMSGDRGEST